jgi:hypothetical protein
MAVDLSEVARLLEVEAFDVVPEENAAATPMRQIYTSGIKDGLRRAAEFVRRLAVKEEEGKLDET